MGETVREFQKTPQPRPREGEKEVLPTVGVSGSERDSSPSQRSYKGAQTGGRSTARTRRQGDYGRRDEQGRVCPVPPGATVPRLGGPQGSSPT